MDFFSQGYFLEVLISMQIYFEYFLKKNTVKFNRKISWNIFNNFKKKKL